MTVKEAVQAILDRVPALKQHLGLKHEDITSVLEALGVLDAPRLSQIAPWLEDLVGTMDQLTRLFGQQKPKTWINAKLFGVKLPEMKKYESLVERARFIWAKERPGILPKIVAEKKSADKEKP